VANGIQIREFGKEDLPSVYRLVQNTIDISYHEAYPIEAIEFFKDHHSKKNILNDAATGTLLGTNVRRVFVSPVHQHRGIGQLIAQELERKASLDKLVALDLASSLVARQFWESLGFVMQREDYVPVWNGQKLLFYRMAKTLE
jgi:GNAT superfamily N-acetyltransferase